MATSTIKNGQDTGWIVLNLTYNAKYRVRNGILFIIIKYDGTISDGTLIGTLPSQYVPNDIMRYLNYSPGSLDSPICLQISTDGKCHIVGAGNKWININGSYPV